MDPALQFKLEPRDDGDGSSTPPKKKQKRNKPTLSCEECVERKTKVRPVAMRCNAMRPTFLLESIQKKMIPAPKMADSLP